LPGALQTIATEMMRHPFAWCFGRCRNIDENGREIRQVITRYKTWQCRNYSYRRLLRRLFIPQPATFFTRQACIETGEIATDLNFTMDYDYWLRLGKRYNPHYVDSYLACFRVHGASKNGAFYRRAAWEAFCTARKHAPPGSTFDLFLHFVHFCLLVTVYPFL
ncbi:MAG: glycosyltransferase, partial [Kiritimatiellae bacterium]|nr:glycosyltransferase [Kiritimatiellia bacterium]